MVFTTKIRVVELMNELSAISVFLQCLVCSNVLIILERQRFAFGASLDSLRARLET